MGSTMSVAIRGSPARRRASRSAHRIHRVAQHTSSGPGAGRTRKEVPSSACKAAWEAMAASRWEEKKTK